MINQYDVYWLISITMPFRCHGYRDEQDLERSYLYEALLEKKYAQWGIFTHLLDVCLWEISLIFCECFFNFVKILLIFEI